MKIRRMKTNLKGEYIRFLVCDEGVIEITESHEAFDDEDAAEFPVYDDPIEAMMKAIEFLSQRIRDLEKSKL